MHPDFLEQTCRELLDALGESCRLNQDLLRTCDEQRRIIEEMKTLLESQLKINGEVLRFFPEPTDALRFIAPLGGRAGYVSAEDYEQYCHEREKRLHPETTEAEEEEPPLPSHIAKMWAEKEVLHICFCWTCGDMRCCRQNENGVQTCTTCGRNPKLLQGQQEAGRQSESRPAAESPAGQSPRKEEI